MKKLILLLSVVFAVFSVQATNVLVDWDPVKNIFDNNPSFPSTHAAEVWDEISGLGFDILDIDATTNGTKEENDASITIFGNAQEKLSFDSPSWPDDRWLTYDASGLTVGDVYTMTFTTAGGNAFNQFARIKLSAWETGSAPSSITVNNSSDADINGSTDTAPITKTKQFTVTNANMTFALGFASNGGDFYITNWKIEKTGQSGPNTETDITAFTFTEQTGDATIDEENHTVSIEVAYGTDITSLSPSITLSSAASVSPNTGVAQNFTNPVTYTVTAEDGTTDQDWTVTVTVAAASTETDITAFSLAEQVKDATIDTENHTVTIEVAKETNVTNLTPTITVSDDATVSPNTGVAQDFTNPVTYTVTAQDGTTDQDWTVTVIEELPSLKVDFGTSQGSEAGYYVYEALDETGVAESATILASYVDSIYAAFDTDITFSISFSSGVTRPAFRGAADDLTEKNALAADLCAINKDKTDSIYLNFSGLPAGTYELTTYHHGPWWASWGTLVDINIDNGTTVVTTNDVAHSGNASAAVSTSPLSFTTNGVHSVVAAISNAADAASWILVSGFDLVQTFSNGIPNSLHKDKTTSFQLYPNPADNLLNISGVEDNVMIEIYNTAGQKVRSTMSKTIEVSDLKQGIYYVKAGNMVQPFAKK